VHWVQVMLPVAGVAVPGGQSAQAVLAFSPPVALPLMPMGQGRQKVPSGEAYVPTAHCTQAGEPEVGAMEPEAQGVQLAASLAPTVEEAFPGAQGMQPLEVCPGAGL
jgi:hypothetical protein